MPSVCGTPRGRTAHRASRQGPGFGAWPRVLAGRGHHSGPQEPMLGDSASACWLTFCVGDFGDLLYTLGGMEVMGGPRGGWVARGSLSQYT